jgi:hypothetical protein
LTIAPLNTADTHIVALDTHRARPDLPAGLSETDRALNPGGTTEAFYPALAVAGGRHG